MKVEIRPLDLEKWHGNSGSDDIGRPQAWPCAINPTTRLYDIEFSEEDKKFFENYNYDLSLQPKYDQKGRPLAHPTWDTKLGKLKLPNRTIILDTNDPIDRIQFLIAKKCPLVAPSEAASKGPNYPHARFYIFSEEEEVQAKEEKVAIKRKAMELSLKLTQEDKKNLIWVMEGKDVTGKSEGFVNVLIDELVEGNPKEFLTYATKDKELLYTRALIEEAVHKEVLVKDGGAITYGSELLGADIEDAVNFLMKEKNQPIKVRIMGRLNK